MMTPKEQELANLSRTYRESRPKIDALILKLLRKGEPQVLIAQAFGYSTFAISQRATKNGIHYYKKKDK